MECQMAEKKFVHYLKFKCLMVDQLRAQNEHFLLSHFKLFSAGVELFEEHVICLTSRGRHL